MSTEVEIEQLKKIELDILKEFIAVCDKLNLRYMVDYGTLLGAVRHKGFIPWDDDIDVAMPRPDFDIFMEKAQSLLPKNLFVQNYHSDKNFPRLYAKIRNSDTTFLEKDYSCTDMNHGIYIDIFALDGVPEDKQEQQKLFDKIIKLLAKIMYYNNIYYTEVDYFYHKNPIIRFLKQAKKFYYKHLTNKDKNVAKLRRKAEKILRQNDYEKSEFVGDLSAAYSTKEFLPKAMFENLIKLQFENLQVNAPADYDRYLTCVYGDYMTLPPEEERVSVHNAKIVDCNNSYKKYINK